MPKRINNQKKLDKMREQLVKVTHNHQYNHNRHTFYNATQYLTEYKRIEDILHNHSVLAPSTIQRLNNKKKDYAEMLKDLFDNKMAREINEIIKNKLSK